MFLNFQNHKNVFELNDCRSKNKQVSNSYLHVPFSIRNASPALHNWFDGPESKDAVKRAKVKNIKIGSTPKFQQTIMNLTVLSCRDMNVTVLQELGVKEKPNFLLETIPRLLPQIINVIMNRMTFNNS